MFKNKMFSDSLALACVKVFTMATSIVSTMILSRALPLVEYGTYSTGNLIINTATLVSAFGLIDAVNFYYNGRKSNERENYVNTVFSILLICGVIAATVIIIGQKMISAYFHNPSLGTIYLYIAFRPLIQNYSLGLQNLQVSIGKAKIVAIRNTLISSTKLCAVILTAIYTKDIRTIFLCMLVVEGVALLLFYKVLWDNRVFVNPFKIDTTKLVEILVFCIPMGIYIQTNTLSRDLDKYVIGFYETTEKLAIYANCSTKLPFDLIAGPLLTLLIPVLTRCIHSDDYRNGSELFKCYIKIGYIFTFAFGFGTIIIATQTVQLLYGSKYLEGVPVFIIYIIVDMINFISYSLVLAARGRTKTLMKVSIIAVFVNLVINIICYHLMGFIGPAIATVLVTFGTSFVLMKYSADILNEKIWKLFDANHLAIFGSEILVMSIVMTFIRRYLEFQAIHYIAIIIAVGGVFVGVVLLLNIKEIKRCFKILNEIRQTQTIE